MVYNPSEPRDPLGKWMKAHGGNPKASLADNVKNLNYAEEHGAAVDTKNTPTAVIDQIAKTGKDDNPGKYMSADFDPMEYFGLND